MTITDKYLPGNRERARHMRLDIARILKRFHFCERAIILAQAGWIAGMASFDAKTLIPEFFWQDALIGDELRTRVFELRYPSRLLEIGDDAPVVEIFQEAINAPNGLAFVRALAEVYKPAQQAAYQAYLDIADDLADGPSIHFFRVALQDKQAQVETLSRIASDMQATASEADRQAADAWVAALQKRIDEVGGLGLEAPQAAATPLQIPGHKDFEFAEIPARDPKFALCRYYWPNVVDETFPYGEGMLLQLRSAVSHFNEVWAIETGGAILQAFADKLDWEFIVDAARWTYDEARHTRMGYERLSEWGFAPEEMPLGTYIFDSAKGEDPIIRLGMLHYFETKNIGKKTDRAEAFSQYQDSVSQHDMEFDWADETIHAHYGSKWLLALREKFPDLPDKDTIHRRCDELVEKQIATATDEDRDRIFAIANAMIEKAKKIAQ